MSDTKKQVMYHSQRYIRSVFSDCLERNGFSNFQGKDCAWYRVTDGQVIQAIYFYTPGLYIPVLLEMAYGVHPAYISPIYPSNVYYHNIPESREVFNHTFISKLHNTVCSPDILVSCPNDEYKGFDALETVLSKIDLIRSEEEAYKEHKARYCNRCYRSASIEFIDEVIVNKDEDLFAPCIDTIDLQILRWSAFSNRTQAIDDTLNHLALQRKTILSGEREEFLNVISKRRKRNIATLERKVGICL